MSVHTNKKIKIRYSVVVSRYIEIDVDVLAGSVSPDKEEIRNYLNEQVEYDYECQILCFEIKDEDVVVDEMFKACKQCE